MFYFVGVAGEVICFADGRFCPPFTNNKIHLYKTHRSEGDSAARCNLTPISMGGGIDMSSLEEYFRRYNAICNTMELPAGYPETFKYI